VASGAWKCQEKPSGVYKMQQTTKATAGGAYSAPADSLAGGEGAGCPQESEFKGGNVFETPSI